MAQAIKVGGDKHYTHTQSVPAATWIVAHNLNKYPSVEVVDSAGSKIYTEVVHIDVNNLETRASSAFSGKAFCN